jgi:hypothetical protein
MLVHRMSGLFIWRACYLLLGRSRYMAFQPLHVSTRDPPWGLGAQRERVLNMEAPPPSGLFLDDCLGSIRTQIWPSDLLLRLGHCSPSGRWNRRCGSGPGNTVPPATRHRLPARATVPDGSSSRRSRAGCYKTPTLDFIKAHDFVNIPSFHCPQLHRLTQSGLLVLLFLLLSLPGPLRPANSPCLPTRNGHITNTRSRREPPSHHPR